MSCTGMTDWRPELELAFCETLNTKSLAAPRPETLVK